MQTFKFLATIALVIAAFFGGAAWKNVDSEVEATNTPQSTITSPANPEKEINTPAASTDLPLPDKLNSAELATIRLFEQAAPSVCFITTSNYKRSYYSRNVTEIPRGSGSGFVWDVEGHVITNFHVVQGAHRVQVTLADHSNWEAEVVGVAPGKDLAVLKISAPAEVLTPLPVGTSENIRVGQSVYAIGNPFGLDQTLTTGVVSALGREIESVSGLPIRGAIQSDAAINPGNSGGPLLNSSGKLIGVNTAIYSPSGASAGIGFSIPVDVVKWVVPDLIQYGKVTRPTLGVELTRPLKDIKGALVYNVVPDGPAANAGIQPTLVDNYGRIKLGDIITAIDNISITNNNDLILALENYEVGDKVIVHLLRGEEATKVELNLAPAQ